MPKNNNQSFFDKHEGMVLTALGVLIVSLITAVILNTVALEVEKERSKEVDKNQERQLGKIEKIDRIDNAQLETRKWVAIIADRNRSQLQIINDNKLENAVNAARLEERIKCLHGEK